MEEDLRSLLQDLESLKGCVSDRYRIGSIDEVPISLFSIFADLDLIYSSSCPRFSTTIAIRFR